MISCIVPVYNNEDTIKHVLKTLVKCKDINEIIVIDDASQDNSVEIINSILKSLGKKVKFFTNKRNLGKGGTIVRGIRKSRGDTLLLCDADLSKLDKIHIKCLINKFKQGNDLVVMCRTKNRDWISKLSGERIFNKKIIKPYLNLITEKGNGIEQIINFVHKQNNKKIKFITAPKDIGHIIKYQRNDKVEVLKEYCEEGYQLLITEFILQKMGFKNKLKLIKQKIKY